MTPEPEFTPKCASLLPLVLKNTTDFLLNSAAVTKSFGCDELKALLNLSENKMSLSATATALFRVYISYSSKKKRSYKNKVLIEINKEVIMPKPNANL